MTNGIMYSELDGRSLVFIMMNGKSLGIPREYIQKLINDLTDINQIIERKENASSSKES